MAKPGDPTVADLAVAAHQVLANSLDALALGNVGIPVGQPPRTTLTEPPGARSLLPKRKASWVEQLHRQRLHRGLPDCFQPTQEHERRRSLSKQHCRSDNLLRMGNVQVQRLLDRYQRNSQDLATTLQQGYLDAFKQQLKYITYVVQLPRALSPAHCTASLQHYPKNNCAGSNNLPTLGYYLDHSNGMRLKPDRTIGALIILSCQVGSMAKTRYRPGHRKRETCSHDRVLYCRVRWLHWRF